jgi:hypothetical protein
VSGLSKHFYVEENVNKIYANLANDSFGLDMPIGTIMINRIIAEAVRIGFVKFVEPDKIDRFPEYEIMAGYLKDKWLLIYNACETGAEFSYGFIVTAETVEEAKEKIVNSQFAKERGKRDGENWVGFFEYMICVGASRPDPEMLLKPTPYLQLYWVNRHEQYAAKIKKDNEAFAKDPQGEMRRVIEKVNNEFAGMISAEDIPS